MRRRDITLYFDAGPYGPTLRIDVHDRESIRRFVSLFQALAEGACASQRLSEWAGLQMRGLTDLVLVRSERPTRFEKSVFRVSEAPNSAPCFRWVQSPDVWDDNVQLVSVLGKEDGGPGHQYLSEEGHFDDALIVIAYREGRHLRDQQDA